MYLSPPSPAARIGNLLPDLRPRPRPRLEPATHPEIVQGIRNHRRVDAFTDTHPLFARSKQRVFHRHGRFSGIVVDMLYDHFLARDWQRYHPLPLTDFASDIYADLNAHHHLMPDAMASVIHLMAEEDWLSGYARPIELRHTLRRMSHRFTRRFQRPVDLEPAVEFIDDPGLADDFHAFFPQLIRYVGATAADHSRSHCA